jgi:hypothetical protein
VTRLPDFRLETYFSRWEFTARHNLTASDAHTMAMSELLELADAEDRHAWGTRSLGYTRERSSTRRTSPAWPSCATNAGSTCSATRSTGGWSSIRPARCRRPRTGRSGRCR